MTYDNEEDEEIDTELELKVYQAEMNFKFRTEILRMLFMVLVLALAFTISLLYNGVYTNYTFMMFIAVVSFYLSSGGDMFSKIFDKITKK